MKKKVVVSLIAVLAIPLIIFIIFGSYGVSILTKSPFKSDREIFFCGHVYYRFDYQFANNPLIPYGDESKISFLEIPKEKHLFGMSFSETDKEKVFIYDHSLFGTSIYMKEDHEILPLSKDLPIDYIVVYNHESNKSKFIYESNHIKDLISYYLEIERMYSIDDGEINA